MILKDADKIKEAIQNSDDFVGGSDDIIKVIDSVPEVVISTDTDTISRNAAIDAVEFGITYAKAINKETGEVTVLFEESNAELQKAAYRIKKLPPANNSEIPNSYDTISKAKAIEALKNDMASLDHIIKGMSANDVRLDAYVSQRNQVNYDIYTINNLPPAQHESDPSQIAAQIIHDAIDNTTFAEEAYPGIKEQMHRSVEEWEKLQPVFKEIAEEYKKACEISYINKPLAYALYEVWKKHDRRDTKRNE